MWTTGYWLWSRLSCVATPASQWRLVEIQLLATFSLCGLEAGLPAFQLPMFAKCDALPQGDFFDMFCFRNPFLLCLLAKTLNSWRHQRVGKGLLSCESQSSLNIVRVDVWVVNRCWIRMIFRRKHSVPKMCCPRSIQATHTILMPVTVKFRIDFLVCGLQGDFVWHLSMSAPCYHASKSMPPLPTTSLRSLRAAARSTSSVSLHNACKR